MDLISSIALYIQEISESVIVQSFLVGCISFIFALIGILPSIIGIKTSNNIVFSMGLASGVMISASFVSLLIPAIEIGGIISTIAGFLLGGLIIHIVNNILPHEHFVKGYEGSEKFRNKIKTAWLLVFAMIIHNIPEGAAIGATIAESLTSAITLAIAIGIQNIPESIAIATPFIYTKRSIRSVIWLVTLSGIVEPLSAIFSTTLTLLSREIIPYLLSIAAGAMIYVVSHEIIPEIHEEKREIRATLGLMIGLMLMIILDFCYK